MLSTTSVARNCNHVWTLCVLVKKRESGGFNQHALSHGHTLRPNVGLTCQPSIRRTFCWIENLAIGTRRTRMFHCNVQIVLLPI